MTPGPDALFSEIHTFAQADFDLFAAVSGDDNPIHVDAEFSARTRFGRTVAHGMLLYTVFHGLLIRAGVPARPDAQRLMFPSPTFAGEPVRFEAKLATAGERVKVDLVATRVADGEIVCRGEAEYAPTGVSA